MNKIYCGLLLLVFLTACGDVQRHTTCEHWAEISRGEYLLTNNVWGAMTLQGYTQCIGMATKGNHATMEWSWDWPTEGDQVIAYPSVLFGHKPWNKQTTSQLLPVAIQQMPRIKVNYATRFKGSGSYNLLLESWITSSNPPEPATRSAELAIHLVQNQWPGMPGRKVEAATIGGKRYDFYLEPRMTVPGDDDHWAYLGFVLHQNQPAGEVYLDDFMSWLQQKKYIGQNGYLVSVELGNEVIFGKGKTVVKRFDVEIGR